MHISRLANWLVDVQIGKQANHQASKQAALTASAEQYTTHITYSCARATYASTTCHLCMLFAHSLTHTDSIVLPWCATNPILLSLLLHRRRRRLLLLQSLILQLCNIVAHYGLRFWHGWAVLICSWQQIFYHVAFTVIFLFAFDVRPNILQENRITLHMQSQNVCCFPGRWADVSIYWNIICCFFALRLPSNWVVQMAYTMDWDTPTVYTVYPITLRLCVWLRACLGKLFPPSRSISLARLLSVFVQ